MLRKTRTEYLPQSDTVFSKGYMDYYLKIIRRNHVLTKDENDLVLKASFKYYAIHSLGFLALIYLMKAYYKASLKIDYSVFKSDYMKMAPYYFFGIGSLLSTYFVAERVYCKELKFLVIKYTQVDKEKYLDSKLNKLILDTYYKE